MPMVKVDIQPEIIHWALSQTKADQLGVKLMGYIEQWLDGTKTPTFNQIEEFSKKANIPLGYFFLQTPPQEELHLLEYRTIDSEKLLNPSRNLVDTIQEMERIQDWMKDYRRDTGFDVLPIVGSLKDSDDIVAMAETIRKDMELSPDWYSENNTMGAAFNYIRTRLEQCGIVIMLNGIVGKNTHRPLDSDEFRAFAMADEWAPLIFINAADTQGAKLFSLFHEAAHIWIGVNDFYNDRRNSSIKETEVICNAVAGELMVPNEAFEKAWKKNSTEGFTEKIKELAQEFKCGESVIARKALDHDVITQGEYNQIMECAIRAYREMKENKKSSGGNYYHTMGSRLDRCFVKAICESIQTGRTSYSEAYRLTNTSRKTFNEVALRLGGTI